MRHRSGIVTPLITVAFVACSTRTRPVPLQGTTQDLAGLAGRWSGEYTSQVTGRHGSIEFTVTARGDSAAGAVVMIPQGFSEPLLPWRDTTLEKTQPGTTATRLLTIRLVRVAATGVHGDLVPYADPLTGERLVTTFDGRWSGDSIVGTFVTQPGIVTAAGITGGWWVVRQRP
jgi:hypothetical protein